MADKIPQRWAAVRVHHGERDRHFWWDEGDGGPQFFNSEAEARDWARKECAESSRAIMAILQVTALITAKVEFVVTLPDSQHAAAAESPVG